MCGAMDDNVLPFSGEEGATAYFGPQIGMHVSDVRRALRYAERRLKSLGDLYDDSEATLWHVEMELTEFLVWARQTRASIDTAVKAARAPDVSAWWSALASDDELRGFTDRRNRALKRVEPASERRRLTMDVDDVPCSVSYFVFVGEPYAGDPVFPRCQKHFFRLRNLTEELQARLPAR